MDTDSIMTLPKHLPMPPPVVPLTTLRVLPNISPVKGQPKRRFLDGLSRDQFNCSMNEMNIRLSIFLILLAPLAVYGQTNAGIEQRMREIVIPCIEFREANPIDVLQFLVEASIAANPENRSLGLASTDTPAFKEYYTYDVEDGTPLELKPLTLEYRRISLLEALDRVTKDMGLTYRLENNTLQFFTQDGKRIVRNTSAGKASSGHPLQGVAP